MKDNLWHASLTKEVNVGKSVVWVALLSSLNGMGETDISEGF